jgi:hypothetical protein
VQSAGRCLGSGCKRYGPLRLWKLHDHFLHTLDQDVEVNVLVLVVTGTCESGAVSSADGEDECWRASGSQAESRVLLGGRGTNQSQVLQIRLDLIAKLVRTLPSASLSCGFIRSGPGPA